MTLPRFNDGKDAGALRTIGEVSAALGIRPHVLRYWEEQFPLLRPLKRAGGRRLYRPEDIALIERIDRLVNREGYTLKGARLVLDQPAGLADAAVRDVPPAGAQQASARAAPAQAARDADVLGRLKAIRDALRQALAA